MLYIIEEVLGEEVKTTWKVGEDRPNIKPSSVTMISADGKELNHIISLFTVKGLIHPKTSDVVTIPVTQDRFRMSWYGDLARTIFVNL
jgi:hypothetical protein